jgi:mannose-6-phosphate isomerase-like protein (cupin superfamily)
MNSTVVEQPGLKRISYARPALAGLRGISTLASTDVLSAIVQTLAPGARQGLHAHGSYDGFYFVLAGRARFYGRNNALFAEIGPHEAVLVPRNTPYAFEAAGEEVQLLAINVTDKTALETFTTYEDGADIVDFELFGAEGTRLRHEEMKMAD